MADVIKWVKPNGVEISTNTLAATIEYAESLGWERADKPKPKPKPKPKKAD